MPIVTCICDSEILVLPDLKAMNIAIRNHVAKHKRACVGPERLAEFLTTQVLILASKINPSTWTIRVSTHNQGHSRIYIRNNRTRRPISKTNKHRIWSSVWLILYPLNGFKPLTPKIYSDQASLHFGDFMYLEYTRFKKSKPFAWLGRFRGNCWMVRHLHALPQTLTSPPKFFKTPQNQSSLVRAVYT